MITITKEFSFDMAHRLEGHDGLCNNIHGHTYKLLVTIMRPDGSVKSDLTSSDRGMVWDFKTLKDAVKLVILDKVDHSFMYNSIDKDSTDIALFMKKRINQKLCPVPFRATAENMVSWIFEELEEFFITTSYDIVITKIQLYETPTSYAIWELAPNKITEYTTKYIPDED